MNARHIRKTSSQYYVTLCLGLLLLPFPVLAKTTSSNNSVKTYALQQDSGIIAAIRLQLAEKSLKLFYPQSVERLYTHQNFNPLWLAPAAHAKQSWNAMMMRDCVLQFGFVYADYHPDELRYDLLHAIEDKPQSINGKRNITPAMQKAVSIHQTQTFNLTKPVSLLITYLTCEVNNGLLLTHKDVYQLDTALEQAFYYTGQPLAKQ